MNYPTVYSMPDEMFLIIEKELGKRYPGVKFVNYDVFGDIHGVEEVRVIPALPSALKQNKCDAVISGNGC